MCTAYTLQNPVQCFSDNEEVAHTFIGFLKALNSLRFAEVFSMDVRTILEFLKCKNLAHQDREFHAERVLFANLSIVIPQKALQSKCSLCREQCF